MMKLAALLATIGGFVVGVAYVAPLLIEISPWVAVGVVVVLLIVTSWFEANAREEKLSREVLDRWYPERRSAPREGSDPPEADQGGRPRSGG